MARNSYIHLLLIAALCFGQIASALHIVGHLQLSEHASAHAGLHAELQSGPYAGSHHGLHHDLHGQHHESGSIFSDFDGASHNHVTGIHHHAHAGQPDHHTHAEKDCSIYHAYVSLGWAIQSHQAAQVLPASGAISTAFGPLFILASSADQQRIRAPPIYS